MNKKVLNTHSRLYEKRFLTKERSREFIKRFFCLFVFYLVFSLTSSLYWFPRCTTLLHAAPRNQALTQVAQTQRKLTPLQYFSKEISQTSKCFLDFIHNLILKGLFDTFSRRFRINEFRIYDVSKRVWASCGRLRICGEL
jgi:hypothetical protein